MDDKRVLVWIALTVLSLMVAINVATSVLASDGTRQKTPSSNLQKGAPGYFNYQSALLDSDGNPVPDADYDATFAIYDVATGGTALWSETQTISVTDGLFNATLGVSAPVSPTDWIDGRDLWLGLTIEDDNEMTPRQRLVSVPYAMNASDVWGADIHPLSLYIAGYGQVIDENGQWVGDSTGLIGPTGPTGPSGPSGPAGPPGSFYVNSETAYTNEISVYCDAGDLATGGGYNVDGFGAGEELNENRPIGSPPTGWYLRSLAHTSKTVYVVCADLTP